MFKGFFRSGLNNFFQGSKQDSQNKSQSNEECCDAPPSTSGEMEEENGTFFRLSTDLDGIQVITTTNRPKLLFFNVVDNGSAAYSEGKDDLTVKNSISADSAGVVSADQGLSIKVIDAAGNGWTAEVNAITDTSFTLNWTKVGAGLNVIGQYHAITKIV